MFSQILIITKPLIFDFDHCDMQFSRYMRLIYVSHQKAEIRMKRRSVLQDFLSRSFCSLMADEMHPTLLFQKVPGSHLLSHAVASIVSSAAYGLTIVFGMGTGVSHTRITTGSGLK